MHAILMLCLVTNEGREKKWIISRKWERKEKKSILMCMFGNRERRGKEKRIMYFFLFIWFAIRNEMKWKEEKKKIYIYIYLFFLLLCPYKCKRCINVMGKYVTLCHIILFMWALCFKNHCLHSSPPNL